MPYGATLRAGSPAISRLNRREGGLATQIALGNLASQPDYKATVMKKFIEPALAMK